MTDTAASRILSPLYSTLLAVGTAAISDSLDRLGLPGAAAGIAPLALGQRMVGPAMTVRYVPTGLGRGTVGDYLDNCEPGQVIVLDNNGRTDCTVWGEILTVLAHEKGIAGTAINGACRDIDRAIALDYPIYTRGHFMRTGKDRVEVADVQVPVVLGNVQVRPGDIIVGDSDGIVVVPDAISDQVASLAREIADIEERIVDAARMGLSLGEARERYGYHALQRPVRPS